MATSPLAKRWSPPRRLALRGPVTRRRLALAAMLVPAGVVLAVIVGYPLVLMVITSFQDFGLRALFTGVHGFVGLRDYAAALTDSQFLPSVLRTIVFTAALVAGTLVIGLAVAELMTRVGRPLRTAVGIVMVVAWAIPTVASTVLWEWLFDGLYGVMNFLIAQVRVFGPFSQHLWFTSSVEGFFVIWLLIIWQAVPFVALAAYGAQSQIPREYYEAAQIDGAPGWQAYRQITLRFLRPLVALATVLSVTWDFNVFTQIWVLTQGGPDGGTTTVGVWTYQAAFANNSYGEASAIAVITVAVLMALTAFHVRRLTRAEA